MSTSPAYLKFPPTPTQTLTHYLLLLLALYLLTNPPRRPRPAHLHNLPPELHLLIAEHLPTLNDLSHLSLVSRRLHAPAARTLHLRAAHTHPPTNTCYKRTRTPLHAAASLNLPSAVSALLAHGANPNLHDSRDRTPLFSAALLGHEDVVRILLEGGADPDYAPGNPPWTALHVAVVGGRSGVVGLLVGAGAGLEGRVAGNTALGVAVMVDDGVAVGMLVAAGCSLEDVNLFGYSAVRYAESMRRVEAMRALGVDVGGEVGRKGMGFTFRRYVEEFVEEENEKCLDCD